MSLKHFQFSGITKPGHDKKRPVKIPQNRKKINLISKIYLTFNINKNKFELYRLIINYFLFLANDSSKKDFHELERLEYQKGFISEYGKSELSNCNSFNRAKPC